MSHSVPLLIRALTLPVATPAVKTGPRQRLTRVGYSTPTSNPGCTTYLEADLVSDTITTLSALRNSGGNVRQGKDTKSINVA